MNTEQLLKIAYCSALPAITSKGSARAQQEIIDAYTTSLTSLGALYRSRDLGKVRLGCWLS